jgi:NADPH:quinone reductase-like Zn-dependent oxidoreductase
MKAPRSHEFGDFSKLKLEDLPEAELATDEVRVRVGAAAVNPSDGRRDGGHYAATDPGAGLCRKRR